MSNHFAFSQQHVDTPLSYVPVPGQPAKTGVIQTPQGCTYEHVDSEGVPNMTAWLWYHQNEDGSFAGYEIDGRWMKYRVALSQMLTLTPGRYVGKMVYKVNKGAQFEPLAGQIIVRSATVIMSNNDPLDSNQLLFAFEVAEVGNYKVEFWVEQQYAGDSTVLVQSLSVEDVAADYGGKSVPVVHSIGTAPAPSPEPAPEPTPQPPPAPLQSFRLVGKGGFTLEFTGIFTMAEVNMVLDKLHGWGIVEAA
jgi:hypothetical protein